MRREDLACCVFAFFALVFSGIWVTVFCVFIDGFRLFSLSTL